MQPVEDIWTCNRCGWTYPNHHPSAKHRRNHKKVCGKVVGHIVDDHHRHANGGSSDEASSGDEAAHHHEVLRSTPPATPAQAVESQPRSFDLSAALQKSETATPPAATEAVNGDSASSLDVQKASGMEAPKAEHVTEASKAEVTQKPVLGSAVPHAEDDLWICRACGWTYPNAHPSAKHRRNHKKHCSGKAGPVEHAPGGSSDDDSDGEHHHVRKGSPVKANVAAPAAQPEAEKVKPAPTPMLSSTRELNLDSVVQKETVPEAAAADPSTKVEAAPAVPPTTPAPAPADVVAPTTPSPPAAPVVAPRGSAVPHPEDDLWICKECGWTYPNHHPSAKHRRNHKKHCQGKVAAAAPAVGGSSDDESDEEHHHHSRVHGTKSEIVVDAKNEALQTNSVSREFDLESLKQAATSEAQDEKKPQNGVTLLQGVQSPEVQAPAELEPEKAALLEGTEKEMPPVAVQKQETAAEQDEGSDGKAPAAPKVGSAVPHPDDDIWICKLCGWTYPNHHPSAKHRRNHKKHCSGKVAAAAPHPGGSSDDDSDDEHHHHTRARAARPAVVEVTSEAPPSVTVSRDFSPDLLSKSPSVPEVKQPEDDKPEVVEVVDVQAPAQEEIPAAPAVVSNGVAEEEIFVDAAPAVESKETSESIHTATPSVVAPKENAKQELLHASSPVVEPLDNTGEKKSVGTSSAAAKAGSAVPDPDHDIWICKECGWTYPNQHPSAKHRRNHKKHCSGKVAAAAPASGGSSDDHSDDEHHDHTPGPAHKPEVMNVTNDVAPSLSVSREFSVGLLATEAQAAEVKVDPPESSSVLPPGVEAQAPAEAATPAIASNETTMEEKPVETVAPKVDNVAVAQEILKEETPVAITPAIEPKEVSKKVTKPSASSASLGSAAPHSAGDVWKCGHCDWTYPNAHPSAKHRRNHKKQCAGEAAVKGGSSDDDSDHEAHPSAPAKEHTPVLASAPTGAVTSLSREFTLPAAEVKEEAAPPAPKLVEEPEVAVPPAPPAQAQENEVAAVYKSAPAVLQTPAPKAAGSAAPHPEDPNDIWICKECGWTYPNAHPSAKHRRNHKKHCQGKSAAVGHAPGGSSEDDSEDGSSPRGQTSAAASETAPAAAPIVKERGVLNLSVQPANNTAAEVEAPKTKARTPLSQLVSEEQIREQEAKSKEELKSSAAAAGQKAAHDPQAVWVCKECGWTYPNRHPSAKHRRNHKKVCKKTNSAATRGGSSSDASSDEEHIGHFGKKKCFPCLS